MLRVSDKKIPQIVSWILFLQSLKSLIFVFSKFIVIIDIVYVFYQQQFWVSCIKKQIVSLCV